MRVRGEGGGAGGSEVCRYSERLSQKVKSKKKTKKKKNVFLPSRKVNIIVEVELEGK